MNWKDLSPWIKTGLIFAFIHLLIGIALVGITFQDNSYFNFPLILGDFFLVIIDCLAFFFAGFLLKSYSSNSGLMFSLLVIIFGTIQWFIIGALISLIYKRRSN